MNKKLKCVLIVDDSADDNFFHERKIRKMDLADTIIIKNTGLEALTYLKDCSVLHPELIFLDINMPGMNGWEFLEEYNKLDKELQSKAILIMLTASDNPQNKQRATTWNFVSDFIVKPLNQEHIKLILNKHFTHRL